MVQIDIDIDDFLDSCSKWDRKELIRALIEDGHLPSELVEKDGYFTMPTDSDDEFDNCLRKLMGRSWQLSSGEEEYIKRISNRF